MAILLLLATLQVVGCEFALMGGELEGPVMITVELADSSSGGWEETPIYGLGPHQKMWIPAVVRSVDKGEFPQKPGSRIRLAVHSIARSVGYGYEGKRMQAAFKPGDDDHLELTGFKPASEGTVFLRITLEVISTKAPRAYVALTGEPKQFVRVRVLESSTTDSRLAARTSTWLGLPDGGLKPEVGDIWCLALIRRFSSPGEEFALWRLQVSKPSSSAAP